MQIKRVSVKEKIYFNQASTHPLQSWEWGEFRRTNKNEVVRLGVYQGEKLVDAVQVIFSKIPFTNFRIGTFIKGTRPTREILVALKNLAKEKNAIFIKLEPNVVKNIKRGTDNETPQKHTKITTGFDANKSIELLKKYGCVPGKTLFTPSSFWIDLTKSEELLFKNFSSKTRYNIRLAQRKGVKVVEDNSDYAFERYLELTRETVKRQGFYAHSEKYHRLMWEYLHKRLVSEKKEPVARLLTAVYKKEIITSWIVFVWHEFLYYPYGASTDKYKNVMANNLMMWEAIRYGKKLGLTTFDLWGKEEGKGFTRFKEGYNPQVVTFLGSWDLVASDLYWPYRLAESLRWKILRLKSKFIKPTF